MTEVKKARHLLDWKYFTGDQIREIYLLSRRIKNNRWVYQGYLSGQSVAMLFQKTSTRTRVSFESGINELGGHGIYLDWNNTNFSLSEIAYEAKYLSRNTCAILARMKKHEDLEKMALNSDMPVINGCCDKYHPCQAMADMMTIMITAEETNLEVRPLQLTYVGVYNNVVNSLVSILKGFPVHLTLVCPEKDYVDEESLVLAQKNNQVTFEPDLKKAVIDAHFVYTDTWINMEVFSDPELQKKNQDKIDQMLPYQINGKIMEGSRAFIMHDMPIHTGYEISADMVDDPRSIIFNQAENRLDAQKAILLYLKDMR